MGLPAVAKSVQKAAQSRRWASDAIVRNLMSMSSRSIVFLLAGAAVFAGAAQAAAAGLSPPDATYAGSLGKYANFTSVSYSGIGSYSDGFSSITLGSQPSPFISAHAYGVSANSDPDVNGTITYYVGIDGPDDETIVPLSVAYVMTGTTQVSDSRAYDIYAHADLHLDSQYRGDHISLVDIVKDGNFSVSSSTAWLIASGHSGQVSLSVQSGLVVDSPSSYGSADVFIDPVFTIDSAFAASHPGYSLVFSQGVGNAPTGVPEASTWALMLIGFGAAGAALCRRGGVAART